MRVRRTIRRYAVVILGFVALLWLVSIFGSESSGPSTAKQTPTLPQEPPPYRDFDPNRTLDEGERLLPNVSHYGQSSSLFFDLISNITISDVVRELLFEEEREWASHVAKFDDTQAEAIYVKTSDEVAEDVRIRALAPCKSNQDLRGHLRQGILAIPNLKQVDVLNYVSGVRLGGAWAPRHCRPTSRMAIVVPFRDRQAHLNKLLAYLIPILQRQERDFRFIVSEQYGPGMFNKGRIMNAAFTVAQRLGCDCVIFHDVDMYPQDDRMLYGCSASPRHMGAFVNTLGYELWYDYIAGGVLAITTTQYEAVNGYSNLFWAWGGEDDDMGKRILALNFTLERPDASLGRYSMLKHTKRQRTAPKIIHELLASSATLMGVDGLARPLWRILKVMRKPLYYHIYVDVGQPPHHWVPS